MSKLSQLKQVLQLTTQMDEQAQAEKWSTLPPLQVQRDELLSHIFPLKEQADDSAEFRQILRHVIDLNEQLEKRCRYLHQNLRLQMSGLNKNKKAVAAYQST